MKNVPKLRFKEFEGEWEVKKLGEMLKIKHGKSQKEIEKDDGSYPILGTGGVIGYTDTALYELPTVLIGRKGTINKPRFMDTPFWTIDTLFYSEVSEEYSPKYIYYLFNTINWLKYNEASGVPSLSARTVEKINVKITTCFKEQEKIADFLSSIDSRIENQEEKIENMEETKKGLMQRLFSQEIRFKDENGVEYPEWERKSLSDILTIKTGNSNVQDAVLDGDFPFFDRGEDVKYLNTFLFDNEAIIYAGEGSSFLPRYYHGKYALHQRCYTLHDLKIDGSLKYLYYYLQTQNNHFVSTAVGSTVKSLRMNSFRLCKVFLPSLSEQEKIAGFLSTFDEKIEIEKEILVTLKEIKKGLLQQMFV